MNYSIHTVGLRKEFKTHIEFDKMLKRLYSMFKGRGIRIIMRRTKIGGYFIVIISLNDLLGNDDKLSLIDPMYLQKSISTADEMLTAELGDEYSINHLELSRVDYCINVDVGSSENVSAYIMQLYQSNMKKGYKIIGLENPDFDSRKGFTARNHTAGTEISFYDKQKQLEQRKYECSEQAAGILRIELRLSRRKTVLEHTPGCSDNKERIEYCMCRSREEILTIVRQLVPDGDYYTMKKAQKIITKSVADKKLRERMTEMLRLTKKCCSIRLAKKELFIAYPKMKHEYFNMMMGEFEKINLNPVVLSKSMNSSTIVSLYNYL